MLSALLIALSDLVGRPAARIHRVVHGRVDNPGGYDLIRTVGFIASTHPLAFDLPHAARPGEVLEAVERAIDSVPGDGSSFMPLISSGESSPEIDKLREITPADIRFNFIGDTDERIKDLEPFTLATESAGPLVSERRRREATLDVWITIEQGRARIVFEHDRRLTTETIAALATRFQTTVSRLFSGS